MLNSVIFTYKEEREKVLEIGLEVKGEGRNRIGLLITTKKAYFRIFFYFCKKGLE